MIYACFRCWYLFCFLFGLDLRLIISYTIVIFNIKRYCVYLKTIICTRRLRTDIMQFTFFLSVIQKSRKVPGFACSHRVVCVRDMFSNIMCIIHTECKLYLHHLNIRIQSCRYYNNGLFK